VGDALVDTTAFVARWQPEAIMIKCRVCNAAPNWRCKLTVPYPVTPDGTMHLDRVATAAGQPWPAGAAVPAQVNAGVKEAVNHPDHYGGPDNPYEVIKVLKAWGLEADALLWNTVKYIARAGKKDPAKHVEDLEKARFYLDRRIDALRGK
jgi:hypothetical protein